MHVVTLCFSIAGVGYVFCILYTLLQIIKERCISYRFPNGYAIAYQPWQMTLLKLEGKLFLLIIVGSALFNIAGWLFFFWY